MKDSVEPNIYEIDFAAVDSKSDEEMAATDSELGLQDVVFEAVADMTAIVELSVVEHIEEDGETAPTPLGETAVATVVESVSLLEDSQIDTQNKVQPEADNMTDLIEAPVEQEKLSVVVPDELQLELQQVLDNLLNTSSKAIIPYAQVRQLLASERVKSKLENAQLREALVRDGRLEYFRSGCYLVIDRSDQVMAAYAAGEDPFVDKQRITELVDKVIEILRTDADGHVHHTGVMGAIKSLGDFLGKEELHEFMVRFTSNPKVTTLESGDFRLDTPKPKVVKPAEPDGFVGEDIPPNGVVSKDGTPLSRTQMNKAINKINASEELREVRQRADRRANPRHHGKNFRKRGARAQGKAHGKKTSVDQLIARMNEVKAEDKEHKKKPPTN